MPSRARAEPAPLQISTPHGPARAHITRPPRSRGAVILGHGAGGGVGAPDLVAVREVALGRRISVALVEQPYRVAGRRSPAPAHQLDAAWTAVLQELVAGPLHDLTLVVGGRSSGARVACRTAVGIQASAVLCLAFPLRPPGRSQAPSRLDELDAVPVPTLVVQGERDPFGIPPTSARRQVVRIRGDHSLRSDLSGLQEAVGGWLDAVL